MKQIATKVFTPVILLVLSIFTAIIFFSFYQASETKTAAALVAHTHEVMFQTANILSTMKDNETGSRGFVLTGNPELLEPVILAQKTLPEQLETIRTITADNAAQQSRVDSLTIYINRRIAFSDSTIAARKEKGLDAAIKMISLGNGKAHMDKIRQLTNEMQEEERRLLDTRKIDNEKASGLLNKIIISIILVIVILLAIFARKDYLQTIARKSAEQTLKKNETLLHLMTNNIKDYAIFMLDAQGMVLNWNRVAETVLGYDSFEIIGKPFTVFYTQADIDNDEPRRNLALAEKYGQYETEGIRVKKDGQTFWTNLVFTALKNDRGDFYGYSTMIRDITEKKKTQEQVEFLSRQINYSNDAIFVVDADRKIKSWNRGAENLYGFTIKEVLDKDANVVLKTALTQEEINERVKEIAKKDYWRGEFKRQTKKGKEITVRSSTSGIRGTDGSITGYVAVSFDISDQIALREQVNYLASLVEQSTEAIISVDMNECIISWNSGAEKLFGYSKEQVTGKSLTSIGLTSLSGNDFSTILQTILKTGMSKAETNFLHTDGSAFFGTVTANAIKNEQDAIKSVVFMVNDISLRRQLEERLQKSNEDLEQKVKERTEEITKNEQRYRSLIEHSAEGIALLDENGDIFYRSPASYKIIGNLPLGNALGSIHPEDVATIKEKGGDALKNPGFPIQWQGRFKHANGNYAWMEGTFTNLLYIAGVNAVVANYRNITDRKMAEDKLIANEVRFRSLIENITDAIVLNDAHSKILYQSPSVERILGYTLEERAGTKVLDYIHPDYTERFQELYKILEETPGVPITFQYRFLHKNGSYIWLEGVVTNLLHNPSVNAYVANYRDITERKTSEELLHKSEQLYRNLFENMLNGFAYCKGHFEDGQLIDYTFISVNEEFEKQTGLKNVAGKNISEISPEILVANQEYLDTVCRVALEGKSAKFETYTAPLKKWLSVLLYSPEKEYFVVLVDNITERKTAEQKIKKLNEDLELRVVKRTEQLKKTNEELEAFSYSVSHDLRAPLRAIIGFTAVLEDEYSSQLDEEARRITSIIKSNTLKMGHLIDDLLAFSRTGRQDIIKTHIDTDEMIRNIIDSPEIRQYNMPTAIKWVLHDLPNINADANTLRQVWINLISNAAKYSNKVQNPEIEIDFYQEKDKNIFFVKDNGVGFDEKYKNKLFRVFQRLHSADEFEGTGIGLAIVEKIISKHDGNVWAEAEPGKGATFYFSLPKIEENKLTITHALN